MVGEHVHENDLVINVTKSKKLTNMRASGSDDKARIIPPVVFSLEEALEYIKSNWAWKWQHSLVASHTPMMEMADSNARLQKVD